MVNDSSAPATQGDIQRLDGKIEILGDKLSKEMRELGKQMKDNSEYMMNWMGEQYVHLETKIDDLHKDMGVHFETLASNLDIKYEKYIVTLQNRTTALEKWTGLPVP